MDGGDGPPEPAWDNTRVATFPSRPGSVPVVGLAGDNALAQSRAMTAAADRHLLFGLLALQNGIINQGQLVAAFQAWTLDKSRSLADHLEARGDLTGARRALLEALAEVHLEAHGGDVAKSLAAVSAGKSTRESLVLIGNPEINATLGHVASLIDRCAKDACSMLRCRRIDARNASVASDDQVKSSTAVEVRLGRNFPTFEEGWSLTLGREARLFSPARPTGSSGGRPGQIESLPASEGTKAGCITRRVQ